jgi:hypothetical protein
MQNIKRRIKIRLAGFQFARFILNQKITKIMISKNTIQVARATAKFFISPNGMNIIKEKYG